MRAFLIVLAAAGALIGTTAGALAQDRSLSGGALHPWNGFYVSAFGGVHFQNDQHVTAHNPDPDPGEPTTARIRNSFDTGFTAGAALGYSWQVGRTPWALRLEGEYSYARDSANSFSALGQSVSVTGALQRHSFMANVYLDYDWGRWVPYIGAGVGLYLARLRTGPRGVDEDGDPNDRIDGSHVGPAVQAMAGIYYKITPRWRLGVGYRYQATFDNKFAAIDGEDGSNLGTVNFGMADSHMILVKLNYLF